MFCGLLVEYVLSISSRFRMTEVLPVRRAPKCLALRSSSTSVAFEYGVSWTMSGVCESPGQVLQHLPGRRIGSSHDVLGHSFLMFLHWTFATIRRFLRTGIHSHLMQYITPNGCPKSGVHVEPSSFNSFPKWHSAGLFRRFPSSSTSRGDFWRAQEICSIPMNTIKVTKNNMNLMRLAIMSNKTLTTFFFFSSIFFLRLQHFKLLLSCTLIWILNWFFLLLLIFLIFPSPSLSSFLLLALRF